MFTKPSWKLRRRATFGTLVFALAIIAYVALKWDSTSLAETLVLSMAGLAGGVVTAYIGFATVEDRAIIAQIGHEDHDLYDEILESRQRTSHQNMGPVAHSNHGGRIPEHFDG
jgi:hypothetical protein